MSSPNFFQNFFDSSFMFFLQAAGEILEDEGLFEEEEEDGTGALAMRVYAPLKVDLLISFLLRSCDFADVFG